MKDPSSPDLKGQRARRESIPAWVEQVEPQRYLKMQLHEVETLMQIGDVHSEAMGWCLSTGGVALGILSSMCGIAFTTDFSKLTISTPQLLALNVLLIVFIVSTGFAMFHGRRWAVAQKSRTDSHDEIRDRFERVCPPD